MCRSPRKTYYSQKVKFKSSSKPYDKNFTPPFFLTNFLNFSNSTRPHRIWIGNHNSNHHANVANTVFTTFRTNGAINQTKNRTADPFSRGCYVTHGNRYFSFRNLSYNHRTNHVNNVKINAGSRRRTNSFAGCFTFWRRFFFFAVFFFTMVARF